MNVSEGVGKWVRVFFAFLSLFWVSITTPPKSSTFQNGQQVEEVARNLQLGLYDDFARRKRRDEIDMLVRISMTVQISDSPPPPSDFFRFVYPQKIYYATEKYYKPEPIDIKDWDLRLGRYKTKY